MIFILDQGHQVVGVLDNTSEGTLHYYDDVIRTKVRGGIKPFDVVIKKQKKFEDLISKICEGNYITKKNKAGKQLLFQIMEVEEGSAKMEKKIYAEDAGMDLINEVYPPVLNEKDKVESEKAQKEYDAKREKALKTSESKGFESDDSVPPQKEIVIHKRRKFVDLIKTVLYDTGWEIGEIDESLQTSERQFESQQYQTGLERLNSICQVFECDYDFTVDFDGSQVKKMYCNFYKEIGKDTGVIYDADRDLIDATKIVDITRVITGVELAGKEIPQYKEVIEEQKTTKVDNAPSSGGGNNNSSGGGGNKKNPYGISDKKEKAIQNCLQQLGWPYVWGGESRAEGGFDCSGLFDYGFKQAGYGLRGRTTTYTIHGQQGWHKISRNQATRGDVVIVNGVNHVVMLLQPLSVSDKILHAPQPGQKICYSNLKYFNVTGFYRINGE